MDAKLLERLRNKTVFIAGSSKNAGKTTFLNYLLPFMRNQQNFAFLTIGVDGEKKDLVFGNEKPAIKTEPGDVFLTSETNFSASSASLEILDVFPWRTVLGRLILCRTRRPGLIELAGPENNEQLHRILKRIKHTWKIGTIFIDGAVNRMTQIAAGLDSSFFYVMTITPENFDSSIDKLKSLSIMGSIKKNEELPIRKGAFTRKDLSRIESTEEEIVLEDFTKIFLTSTELKDLMNKHQVYFSNKYHLESMVINLKNTKKRDLEKKIKPFQIPVLYNPYQMMEGLYDK